MERGHPASVLWLLALCVGCAVPSDPAAPDDDDDATSAQDDDDFTKPVTPADEIETVTFALSLDGVQRPESDRDEVVSEIEGIAHVLYWRDVDAGDLVCRQRFDVSLLGVLSDDLTSPCEGCAGRLRLTGVEAQPPDLDDGCGALPPSVDLSFLVQSQPEAPAPDFRQFELVPWDNLGDTPLTQEGLLPSDVAGRYDALGLKVHHLALITPDGWLGEEALLAQAARPWGEEQHLPMFVLYSNADDGGDGEQLSGPLYLASLWRVSVGESLGTSPAQ